MENIQKTAVIQRNSTGNMIVDNDGSVTCVCKDGLQFKINVGDIDFTCDWLQCTMGNDNILVILKADNRCQPLMNNVPHNETSPIHSSLLSTPMALSEEKESANSNMTTTRNDTFFAWSDASTKLFLNLYRTKRDMVTERKIRTHRMMWKQISDKMVELGYSVSAVQVENKCTTLKRAHKNMVSNNKKTKRRRSTCNFESELTEFLGKKHNIVPLAVSHRGGLTVRKENLVLDTAHSSNSVLPKAAAISSTFACESPSEPPENFDETVINTSAHDNVASKKRRTNMGSTAKSISQCQAAIDNFTSVMQQQRSRQEEIQLELLRQNEEFMRLNQEQRAVANKQREEMNSLLKTLIEILKKDDGDRH